MRAIGLFVLLILLIAAVFFSMANREMVEIGFWPLGVQQATPLFLPILAALVIGFFAGWAGAWRAAGRLRRQLRQALRDNRDAAIAIDRLKQDLKAAQSAQAPAQATGPAGGPGGPPQIAA